MSHYYVAKNGKDKNSGSVEAPFLTIQHAANLAVPGDTITVNGGTYREWVNPKRGGDNENSRITYEAKQDEEVIIKGSEKVSDWSLLKDNVWQCSIDNALFAGFNPFEENVAGDWLTSTDSYHLGSVYLNGQEMYEVHSLEEVIHPTKKKTIINLFNKETYEFKNQEATKFVWYAVVGEKETKVYANFQGSDPNINLIEVNCRPCCFYPKDTGINYITVKNFEMCQAATQWAPPTGPQIGMVGPHWSKGWQIKNNTLHNSKCTAISLGKELSTGNNFSLRFGDKSGYTYQLEAVLSAQYKDWNKENIGNHIVEGNTIYDCGQAGIVGHMGCAFSKISHNIIYNVGIREEFKGWEQAGIKLHAAVDVEISDNKIFNCNLGTWLDWEAQGTRISRNVYYSNGLDFFVEVSHGPYIVDNNIMASKHSLQNFSQGGAYINNLICGDMDIRSVNNRSTPYHYAHSTKIKGIAYIKSGDDRYYNNIFVKNSTGKKAHGTDAFSDNPVSLTEFIKAVRALGPIDIAGFNQVKEPVYLKHNVYWHGANASQKEKDNLIEPDFDPKIEMHEIDNHLYLTIDITQKLLNYITTPAETITLGRTRLSNAPFDNFNGDNLKINEDLQHHTVEMVIAGPLQKLKIGINKIKLT